MKIVLKTKNLKLTEDLKDFIKEKINSLEKFSETLRNEKKYFDHFFGKGKPKIEAWVEVGKTTFHHQKGNYFFIECQMRFPKKSLRVVVKGENLKQTMTQVKDKLQRQLKQYKNKLIAKTQRGQRTLKKELKLSPVARLYRKGRIREEGI